MRAARLRYVTESRRSFARAANGTGLLSSARADTWGKLPADVRAVVKGMTPAAAGARLFSHKRSVTSSTWTSVHPLDVFDI